MEEDYNLCVEGAPIHLPPTTSRCEVVEEVVFLAKRR